MNIRDIREQRAVHVAEMRSLLATAETEKRQLNAAEQARFDALKATITEGEAAEARAQFLEDAERRMAGAPADRAGRDPDFDRSCREFSLRAAIAAQLPNSTVDAGREREVSAELVRRSGRAFEGIAVPTQIFEQRVVTTALPAGGPGANIIATDHRGDLYIDKLRAALRVRGLGATVLSGLTGNVDIPRLKTSATSGWIAENAALSASDVEVDKVTLSPKHVGALTEYSRNMLMQSSPDIEVLLRGDFAKILAQAIDQAAIKGGGANEPTGILGTAGIGSVAIGANGGPITWASVVDLIAECEIDNVSGSGFLTNAKVVKSARKTAKVSATDSVMVMESPTELAGYPVAVTNLVLSTLVKGASGAVCSALVFGYWPDLLLGYWSELDVLVNPYETTAYSKGNVLIRALATMDVDVRHPESFAATQDLTTP